MILLKNYLARTALVTHFFRLLLINIISTYSFFFLSQTQNYSELKLRMIVLLNLFSQFAKIIIIKVPILKECHIGKMKLWHIEHFWTLFSSLLGVIAAVFSNHAQKWRQKVSKSVQRPRVSLSRSDILSKLVL